jgi:hypothetical protein
MVILVSLRGHPLAILDRDARHVRLNLCLRCYDKIHNLEYFYKGDRGNGLETRPRAKPSQRGCNPNLPALTRATPAL